MPKSGVMAIFILLVFGRAVADMPDKGKQATSFHPQNDISHGWEKQGKGKQPQFVQGEVLVKFKAGVTGEVIDGIRKAYGLSLMERIENIGVYRFKILPTSRVKDIVDALNEHPQVEYAEPNYTVTVPGK